MNFLKQRRFAEPPHAPSRQTGACCEAPLSPSLSYSQEIRKWHHSDARSESHTKIETDRHMTAYDSKTNRLNCTLKIIEEVSTDFYRCHQTIRGQLEIVTFSATQADSAGLASSVLPTAAAGSGISMPAFFPPILMSETATKIIMTA